MFMFSREKKKNHHNTCFPLFLKKKEERAIESGGARRPKGAESSPLNDLRCCHKLKGESKREKSVRAHTRGENK